MPLRGTLRLSIALLSLVAFSGLATHPAQADEPKPKPENTITIQSEPSPQQNSSGHPNFGLPTLPIVPGTPSPCW